MSTESGREVIQTATVAIFSLCMREVLLIFNTKIGGLVPVGGKFDPKRDRTIEDTAIFEAREEAEIELCSSGTFLDIMGNPTDEQVVICRSDFLFPKGQQGHDTLYFFRLHEKPRFELPKGVYFLNREKYSEEGVEIDGKMYEFRALDIKQKILAVMK